MTSQVPQTLKQILIELNNASVLGRDNAIHEAEQAITTLMLEVIGKPDKESRKHNQVVRNQLIREQRNRLQQLLKDKEGK